jgi:hypothetical protein
MALHVFVAALLLAGAAADDRNDPHKRTIRGSVLDATTGEPLPGALLKTGSKSVEASTTPDGSFTAEVEDTGEIGLWIEKQGYVNDPLFPFTVGDKEEPVVLRVFRGGAMTGRIIDAKTRSPVKKISVGAVRVVYKEGRRFPLKNSPRQRTRKVASVCPAFCRALSMLKRRQAPTLRRES